MILNPDSDRSHILAFGIVEWLRTSIREGAIAPGEWIRLGKIAKRFGVSQTPVREALRILLHEGLVERLPHRGIRVVEVSAEGAQDLFGCRMVLESHAARLAADLMTDEELDDLCLLRQRVSDAVDGKRIVEYQQLNEKLHMMIIDGSRQEAIKRTVSGLWSAYPTMLWPHFRPGTRENLELRFAEDEGEHDRIVEALTKRDPDGAETAMRRHLERSVSSLLSTA